MRGTSYQEKYKYLPELFLSLFSVIMSDVHRYIYKHLQKNVYNMLNIVRRQLSPVKVSDAKIFPSRGNKIRFKKIFLSFVGCFFFI